MRLSERFLVILLLRRVRPLERMNAQNPRLMSDDTLPFTTESYLHAKSVRTGVPARRKAPALPACAAASLPIWHGREPRQLDRRLPFTAPLLAPTDELAQRQSLPDRARQRSDRTAGPP